MTTIDAFTELRRKSPPRDLLSDRSPSGDGPPTIVAICSPSYSGSTMLDLMLGHAEDAFSCGEVGFAYRPLRKGRRSPLCSCGVMDCPVWDALLRLPGDRFHRDAAALLGARFVIDSTKRLSWIYELQVTARHGAYRVRNLAPWKTMPEYAHSLWKRQKPLKTGLARYLRYYRQLASLRIPVATVPARQLTEAPAVTLEAVCAWLRMAYFPGKEAYWRKPHHALFGSQVATRELRAEKPEIYQTVNYPAEFREAYRPWADWEADDEVQGLYRWLEARDVTRLPPEEAPADGSLPRPAWLWWRQWTESWKSRCRSFNLASRRR